MSSLGLMVILFSCNCYSISIYDAEYFLVSVCSASFGFKGLLQNFVKQIEENRREEEEGPKQKKNFVQIKQGKKDCLETKLY